MYIMRQSLINLDESDGPVFVKDNVTVEDIRPDELGRVVGIWKEKVDGKIVSRRVTHYKFYANTWQFI